ncbi:MAG: hypothetical protein C3F07_01600 [Anaerolineales bacterium]|nr:MAG: hypothetical protein C3F07_01600 [Anaerolineales bacterium]
MNNNPSKQPSLLTILTLAFTLSGLLISVSIIAILYNNLKAGLQEELKNRLLTITSIAALQQDGDTLLKVSARDDEYYKIINERNLKIRSADSDIIYVYTMRKNEEGIYFVVDANLPGDEGIADFGQPYLEPGPTLEQNFDTIDRTIIEPEIYTDEFGSFLSAYAPIYASTGERVGVLGIDIAADKIVARERRILNQSLLLFAVSLPVIALLGYLLGRFVTSPYVKLTTIAQKIASGNLEESTQIPANSREAALLADSFRTMTQKLRQLVGTLELQVADRTQKLEKRASQSQAVSSVARAITTIQDIDLLLPKITELVCEHFGVYHTGIFLVDEENKLAILRASNSPGGQKMLSRRHRLKLDTNSIVGYVASRGNPRIALDVGTDAFFFNNPDLPETRSEMALPLSIGGRVIGVLDVQSTHPNAFAEEDVATLSTLADQIAIAIENTRLFAEAQNALRDSETSFERYIKQEWSSFARRIKNTGYTFDGTRSQPIKSKDGREKVKTVTQTGRLSLERDNGGITIPIRLRGQTIGMLDVKPKNGSRKWTQDEITLLEAAAERAALALENARLVESAQQRAARERTIGEISARLGSVSDVEAIMQTAVEELGRKIGGATEVTIEFSEEGSQE